MLGNYFHGWVGVAAGLCGYNTTSAQLGLALAELGKNKFEKIDNFAGKNDEGLIINTKKCLYETLISEISYYDFLLKKISANFTHLT